MIALPQCATHDRTPVTVMLTPEQAARLELWLAKHRDANPSADDNEHVDQVFASGLRLVEAEQMVGSADEVIAIQRELAYSAARSDIECLGLSLGGGWYQVVMGTADEDTAVLNFALRYLAAIGMLESSPANPGAVRVRSLEEEAKA